MNYCPSLLDLSKIIQDLNLTDCRLGQFVNSRSIDMMLVLMGHENVTSYKVYIISIYYAT